MRPHPLTFENALKSDAMTNSEIKEYKTQNLNAGIVFDDNASIDDTLKHVDVMITDFSSVIINAFLCGIIIIYTGKETTLTPIDTFRKIMDCSYHAENWDQVLSILNMLRNNNDPLFEQRTVLADLMRKEHIDSDKAILRDIIQDYYS